MKITLGKSDKNAVRQADAGYRVTFVTNWMRWLQKGWWAYLFEKPRRPDWCSWPARLWCRYRGHPCGVVWYNVGGLEPDMSCKRCADDLG